MKLIYYIKNALGFIIVLLLIMSSIQYMFLFADIPNVYGNSIDTTEALLLFLNLNTNFALIAIYTIMVFKQNYRCNYAIILFSALNFVFWINFILPNFSSSNKDILNLIDNIYIVEGLLNHICILASQLILVVFKR